MSGRVCDKHQEWRPEGVCRWCEPREPVAPAHGVFSLWSQSINQPPPTFSELQRQMNVMWAQMAASKVDR